MKSCGSTPWDRGMLRHYHTLFFDVLRAFRAGACRRNVDGFRLSACGVGGVSDDRRRAVNLPFGLSQLAVAILLIDAVVTTRRHRVR